MAATAEPLTPVGRGPDPIRLPAVFREPETDARETGEWTWSDTLILASISDRPRGSTRTEVLRAADYFNHGAPSGPETESALRALSAAALVERVPGVPAPARYRTTPAGCALKSEWRVAHTWSTVLLSRLRHVEHPESRQR